MTSHENKATATEADVDLARLAEHLLEKYGVTGELTYAYTVRGLSHVICGRTVIAGVTYCAKLVNAGRGEKTMLIRYGVPVSPASLQRRIVRGVASGL